MRYSSITRAMLAAWWRLIRTSDQNFREKILARLLQASKNFLKMSTSFSSNVSATATALETLEKLKDLYCDIAQVPVPESARLVYHKANHIQIASIWSNRAVQLKKIVKMQRISTVVPKAGEPNILERISTVSLPFASTE
ncbi:unnamed protein product [Gongylonema pulchrum]|uniref:Ras-GEF domain-containing protein n=1 Tax=Gongylonema pulchrum TaxID=637853 RepID=A0A183D3P9_9BILA|nr:unnamed protein product [Gongylonema pulchrum]